MFKGSIVALITPFKNDAWDTNNYIKLLNHHIEKGTNGVVPAGTTGESLLTHDEHKKLSKYLLKNVCNTLNCGNRINPTVEAIELSKYAENPEPMGF